MNARRNSPFPILVIVLLASVCLIIAEYANDALTYLSGTTSAQIREPEIAAGTAFFVNSEGYLLTNAHVVSNCKEIRTADREWIRLIAVDKEADLALLREELVWEDDKHPIATFRPFSPQVGDPVVVFGFPLPNLFSADGNLSTGTVAAKLGLRDNRRFIQITAPVRPGDAGGPVLDSGGNVIGVVVAKLDVIKAVKPSEDVPENVNFAIPSSAAIRFLQTNYVSYRVAEHASGLETVDVAATAKQFTVAIQCKK